MYIVMKIFCYMILFTNYHKIKLINQQNITKNNQLTKSKF